MNVFESSGKEASWHGNIQSRVAEVEREKEGNKAVELEFRAQVMGLDLVGEGKKQRKEWG